MSWECADCGVVEDEEHITIGVKEVNAKIEVVCHHCGKPLCQRHRIRIEDEAFCNEEEPVERLAYHCDECKKTYHSNATVEVE